MSKKLKGLLLALVVCLQAVVPVARAEAATVLYNNATGSEGRYNYELWKDYGDTSMTLKGNGLFECWWQNIGNVLFRKGVKWDCTKTYSQLGNITVSYGVDYQPNGNSYLCVYGWCRNPLVEYYIVDCWGTWRPPGATSKGTITVDGATYDVYETTRVNQPSIDGNTTFQQYWSVRQSKRTSGTISVTEHFKAWERMGMKMGLMYEAAFNVEGYQSSGWADVYKLDITVGGSSSSGSSSSGDSASSAPGTNKGTEIECESMTKSGQYTGTISNPFNGVALYANDDAVSTTVNFTSGTHDFTLRGASNNDNLAKVDLLIGGQNKGTFYFGDANTAEYTIKNVSHGTGNQKVELKVTADDGQWDAYADCLIIGGSGVSTGSNTGSNTGNTGSNTGNTGTSTATTKQCEDMTKSGQYTGTISNPFNGVALYANNDAVSYTQYFSEGSHDFTLRGASNGDNMARVDLVIGNETKGTFYFGDANVAEYTIS
ncbi:MAG: glycoside hydrolase family 11 protein, partial [Lachnospiraceae bacterium]|nr:glycoside hydrolase family 11 protein [Lachnospiraceae bacterium]